MSFERVIRTADCVKTLSGTPLGEEAYEYRGFYRGDNCLAVYILRADAPTDLRELQQRIAKGEQFGVGSA